MGKNGENHQTRQFYTVVWFVENAQKIHNSAFHSQ